MNLTYNADPSEKQAPTIKTKLVIALPMNECNINFLTCLISLEMYLKMHNIDYIISLEGGSNVSFVREKCLGIKEPDTVTTKMVEPFYGTVDYEYIMWIDSDVIFKPEDVMTLMAHNVDIAAGFYKKNPVYYTATKYTDNPDFLFAMKNEDVVGDKLIELAAVGFGFVLTKKGVFERVPRPWFLTTVWDYGSGPRICGEDTYFCLKARENGFKIWGDPQVKVSHMKYALLR